MKINNSIEGNENNLVLQEEKECRLPEEVVKKAGKERLIKYAQTEKKKKGM
jgi:hypothetical protein